MSETVRPAPRRRFWRFVRRSMAVMAVLILALLGAGQIAKSRLKARYPAPGQRVDLGGYALHIRCTGQGSPAVILESGLGSDSLGWASVQPALARQTRVCAYDRAGYGWSDRSPRPRTAMIAVDELRALLQKAGVAPPYVLVGHSLGGVYVKLYAHRYPAEVAGLVLVDPSDERDLSDLPPDYREHYRTMIAETQDGMGTLKLLINSGIPALWPALLGGDERLPAEANAAAAALQASGSASLQTSVDELLGLEASFDEVRAANIETLGDIPLALLLAGRAEGDGVTPELVLSGADLAAAEERQRERMARLSGLSPRGQVEVIEDSGHHIQLDRPDAVIAAVEKVLTATR